MTYYKSMTYCWWTHAANSNMELRALDDEKIRFFGRNERLSIKFCVGVGSGKRVVGNSAAVGGGWVFAACGVERSLGLQPCTHRSGTPCALRTPPWGSSRL